MPHDREGVSNQLSRVQGRPDGRLCASSLIYGNFHFIRALPTLALVGHEMMKRALIGILSVGILAVPVGVETANAQAYSTYSSPRTYTLPAYTPQRRGSVRRGVPRSAPFSNPDSPAATGGGSLGYNQNLYNW